VQDQALRGGLVAAVLLQEDAQRVTQPGVVVVVVRQRPEGLGDPGPEQLERARHQGQRRHLGEGGDRRGGRPGGQRHRLGAQRLLVGPAEARHPGRGLAERELDPVPARDALDVHVGQGDVEPAA
jgi:hypothetical protein